MALPQVTRDAPHRVRASHAPAIVLGLLCVLYLLLFVDRVNISAIAPLLRTDLKLSNSQLGLVFSAFAVPYAAFQLVGGWVGDYLGPRLALSLCCIVVSLATILTGLAGGFVFLFALRIALGFGEGAAFPTATRAMSRWTSPQRWAFAQGITHSFSRIGNAMTPPLMAALLLVMSWRRAFLLLGLISLMWTIVWAWYYRDEPRDHPSMRPEDLASLPPARPRAPVPWQRLARRIAPLTLVDFCYGWTLWLFLTWIPSFFAENYHLNLQSSSLFSAGVLFAGVIGDAAGGLICDRIYRVTGNRGIARVRVIQAGFAGGFLFLIPVVLVQDLHVAAICLSGAFFFAELIVGPIWSIPMDIAPRYAGTASGMMNFGFGIAGLISPSTFGYLVDLTGSWVLPFVLSMALLLAGAFLVGRIRPERPFEDFRSSSSYRFI